MLGYYLYKSFFEQISIMLTKQVNVIIRNLLNIYTIPLISPCLNI